MTTTPGQIAARAARNQGMTEHRTKRLCEEFDLDNGGAWILRMHEYCWTKSTRSRCQRVRTLSDVGKRTRLLHVARGQPSLSTALAMLRW